jgi:hypothetical protein
MIGTLLLVAAAGCLFGLIASVIMSWASDRSALWNMVIGGVLALAVLVSALGIAVLLTRAAYPN